jgi:phenylalanyl-tRNA synthetase beta subunit
VSISQKQKKEKLSTAGAISQEYFFLEDLYFDLRHSIYNEIDLHREIVRQIGFDMFDEIGFSKKTIEKLLSKINSVRKLKRLVIDRDYTIYEFWESCHRATVAVWECSTCGYSPYCLCDQQ